LWFCGFPNKPKFQEVKYGTKLYKHIAIVFKNVFIGVVPRSSGVYGYEGRVGPDSPGIRNTEEKFTKKIQQDAKVYQNFISNLCEAQHVSGDTPPIIRSLKLH